MRPGLSSAAECLSQNIQLWVLIPAVGTRIGLVNILYCFVSKDWALVRGELNCRLTLPVCSCVPETVPGFMGLLCLTVTLV